MKKIIFLLLFSSTIFAQNELERKKISEASNSQEVQQLKQYYFEYLANQKKHIDEYHLTNKTPNNQKHSLQRIIDGIPYFYTTDNAGSVSTLRANSMYPGGSLGLNVIGQGITAGVWDGGKVRNTHQEFVGRLTLGDEASTLNTHSTHVTGTIMAQGVSILRKGFAYGANCKSYEWTSDITEMIAFANAGFLMSNHSYGNNAATLQTQQFGMYSGQAIEVDNVMNTFPYYQIVKSAGNDRSTTTLLQVNIKGGYDLLNGVSTAKNVLTVAAVEEVSNYTGPESVVMSSFSNFGPTDDGRIKPDLSAKGVGVFSTSSTTNSAYTELQGTSMAAPAITGLIVLLQNHYNNLNPSTYMKSASVRGLLCQSTREAGLNPGPDYEFGWGLADGFNAARVISNKGTTAIFDEKTLNNGSSFSSSFTISSTQNINVVIAWTDPTGTANVNGDEDNRTPRLRNNLDVKVLKDGTTYYPWKLDPDSPSVAATNDTDNDADNIERVEIFDATPGTYTIQVTHKGNLQGGTQDYTLIASSTNGLTLNNQDFVVDNNFFVYPNPANDVLNYSNPNNIEISTISISDITGKQVMNFDSISNSNAINVSNLQSGVYFVNFVTDKNSVVKKFIKN
jgi:serine protease AprX